MPSKGALRFVKCDDEGGKHGDKDGLLCHAPLTRLGDPIHVVIHGANVFDCMSFVETEFIFRGNEEVGEDRGGDDDGDEESVVMDGLCAIVVISYPGISVLHVGGL